MLRATIKALLARKLRLALTAVSVVLGVAFVAGTFVLTDTIAGAFEGLFADVNAGTDVSVRTRSSFEEGAAPVPAGLVDTIAGIDGVEAVEGSLFGVAQLVDKSGKAIATQGPTVGTAWVNSPDLNPFRLRRGRGPRAAGEVVIDAGTAREHGFELGDAVTVLSQGPPETFTVVGIAGFGDADNPAGGALISFVDDAARQVLGRPAGFDSIEVAAAEGVTQAELRARIAAVLPVGVEAMTGEATAKESAERVQDNLGFFGTLLLVFAGVSLFVGAFIILNTFQILVAQRTRELGLLRALGASGAQVRRSVLTEAAIVGTVASGAGLGLGVVVALALQRLLESFGIDLPAAETRFRSRTVVVSLVVGFGVTVASSVLPARRAAKVPPVAAIREDVAIDEGGPLRRRTVLGVVVSAAGFAVLLAGTAGAGNGAAYVGVGSLVGFLGATLIAPVATRPVARVVGAPLAGLGVIGRLGRENAMRNPRRTASTAAALMVGLALVTLVSVFAASARKSTDKVIDDVFRADLVLNASQQFATFSPEVARRVRAVPDVDAVAEVRRGEWRSRGARNFLSAADPAELARVLDLELEAGRLEDLADGGVLVHDDEARAKGFEVGELLPMEFPRTGVQRIRIEGIFGANQLTGDYLLSLRDYEANFTDQLDSYAMVKLRAGVDRTAARSAVEDVLAAFPNVELQDQEEFKSEVAGHVDQILNLFYALLGLAILIAVMGIVNTLALSIFERTRELGLLRAVGTSRRQIRAMVRAEGSIIAVLGALFGLVIGVVVSVAMLQALRDDGITETAIPVGRLALFVALAAAAGLGAAVFPARRAARLQILDAIAHE
ncbi:MAG: ABC transporter permease [Actinomycetota bacterium]|nr:ABC transporter permease [Actinomycetota bacterium]